MKTALRRSLLTGLVAGAGIMALTLTGCTSGAGNEPSPTPTYTVTPAPTGEPSDGTARPSSLIPLQQFVPTIEVNDYCPLDPQPVHLHQVDRTVDAAYLCTSSLSVTDGSLTTTISQVGGGLDELVAAYSVPNEAVDPNGMCTLQLEDPLLVWVIYPGQRSYPIYAPVTSCGFPQDEARAAYNALTLTTVGEYSQALDGAISTTKPVPTS